MDYSNMTEDDIDYIIDENDSITSEEEEDDERDVDNVDDDDMLASSDIEDESPDALDKLENFISSLDTGSNKRKLFDGEAAHDGAKEPKPKRRMIKEYTKAGPEGEFNAQSGGKIIPPLY